MTTLLETPASAPPRGRDLSRWALPALLALTAGLYLWGLSANGWANAYYTAAAQAGATSWKAWFFGSLDASNFITVDKPPASLWIMGLAVRLFGLNSWAVLVPQALMGVAAVWLVFATVRRWFGAGAGLVAGLVLALTPVATLMFRFNNPDALLVLLLVAAGYAVTRAIETGSWRWLVLAGAFVGFGFLTKMMQAFLVLPGFAAAYGLAAPITLRRRVQHLVAAFAAMIVSAGWWVAAVALWPASSRPYIGGSQSNSIIELIVGYNGFGRLTGDESGSVSPGGASPWGETGWNRLFSDSYGGQIAWLLPAALIGFAVMLWVSRRAPRTDQVRAAAVLWGGWLMVTAAVISFSAGIIHEYYTVALAPAIAAGVGAGSMLLWQRREAPPARSALAAAVAGSALWAVVLLQRSPDFAPWLSPVIGVLGFVGAAGIALAPVLGERLVKCAAVAGLAAVLVGPFAYSIETVGQPATGSLPTAGPAVVGSHGPGAMGGPPAGAMPMLPGFGAGPAQGSRTGAPPAAAQSGNRLLDASTPSAVVTAVLSEDAANYRWVLATTGSQSAAGYQLATRQPVMSIGGFNGTDPTPTLEQFQALVAAGEIHYYLAGAPGPGGSAATAAQIEAWVTANFDPVTVDGVVLYDLGA